MDGMLSQDEINALLSGMDPSEMSSQPNSEPEGSFAAGMGASSDQELDEVERDAVGEVANISMGSSATTLYSLGKCHRRLRQALCIYTDPLHSGS